MIDAIRTSRYSTFLLLTLALALAGSTTAEIATYDESEQVCQNWLTYVTEKSGGWAGDANPRIAGVREFSANDTLLARCFEISSGGYVLVPVLKDLPPVKAYSETSTFDVDAETGLTLMFREILQHRIRLFTEYYGSMEAVPPKTGDRLFGIQHREQWDRLARPADEFAATFDKLLLLEADGVGPLLTTGWHQGSPYNLNCPMGDGGRCVVGCVATAMAQIMWYHQWPPAGNGSHTYYWYGDYSCGGSTSGQYLTADFSDAYIYQNTNDNLAEINYEVGVAFDMDYGYCASGTYLTPALSVLPDYFRYHSSVGVRYRTSYTAQTWFNLIVDQINQGLPLLYGITSHAIVCDGWRTDLGFNQYHINYGWGGSNTAWYAVDDILCDGWDCYMSHEHVIMNIIPLSGKPWLGESNLSDDLYGDGDSIPEAGETIEVFFTIANYGGAEITDVTTELLFDDESIIIVDGDAYLGTIPGRDSVDNSGDPVSFEIPADYVPRTDSLKLAITWNSAGGGGTDTLFVEKAIGGVPVLLVDDDNNNGLESYYTDALDALRMPYDVWPYSAYSTPDSAYLSKYGVVIWFTGDYTTSPLSLTEIDALRSYMNGGGNLFLTGQGIAAQLHGTDPVFLADYLRSTYVSTSALPILIPAPGQIFVVGDTVVISGSGGASNQDYPDLIQPINGSMGEMKYVNETDFGIVSYSGDYRLVFFAFGFEAVVTGNSRWLGRVEALSKILDFFQCDKPNTCPLASSLSVTSGTPTRMTDHTPTFSWSYSDADGAPQAMYHLQVGTDPNWDVIEMWESGPSAGEDTQLTYAGLELVDGGVYYIRVRVHDGTLWSAWATLNIRMNSLPTVPTGLTPADLSGVGTATPQLTNDNATDNEFDSRKYSYEVYTDETMGTLVTAIGNISEGFPTTSWTVDVTLDEEADYYWRVRASDPYEDGEWSPLAAFGINAVNYPPGAFDLTSPADGAELDDLQPTFEWTPSADPDTYDAVSYALIHSADPTFTPADTVSGVDTNLYAMPDPLAYGEVCFWKILATDMFGGETASSQTYSFSTAVIGDANGDGDINVADAVYIINYVFQGGPAPDPLITGDANCDGAINVADAVYIINYIFNGGPAPGCP